MQRPVDNGERENWKWGAGRNHHPVLNPLLFLSHDDHTALQMFMSTYLMMLMIKPFRKISIYSPDLPFHCYCYWPSHMTPMTNGLVGSQILMKFLAILHQGIHLRIVRHHASQHSRLGIVFCRHFSFAYQPPKLCEHIFLNFPTHINFLCAGLCLLFITMMIVAVFDCCCCYCLFFQSYHWDGPCDRWL